MMSEAKLKQIKELERQASLIERRKQELKEQLEAEKEQAKWYDQVLKESGYTKPRDFIKSAMEHFGIRQISLGKARGGAAVGIASAAASNGKRSRTKVTADLRDKIKSALREGRSKNSIKDEFGVSYPVVKKIEDGGYDKL